MKTSYSLLVVSLLTSASLYGCGSVKPKERQPKPVKTTTVALVSSQDGRRYSASIRPQTQVEVAFKVGGYVDNIPQTKGADGVWRYLQEGDVVSKGAVLARVRPADYAARLDQAKAQVAEAKAALAASQSQLAEAKAGLAASRQQIAEAEAGLRKARLDFERARILYDEQSLTKTDYDAAQAQLDASEAKYEQAKSQSQAMQSKVETAQHQTEVAQNRIKTAQAGEQQASIPLEDTILRSPLSGIVLQRKVEVGTLVSAGSVGYSIADVTSVEAVFGVPDLEVSKAKMGDSLPISAEAVPGEEFRGHITSISPSADANSRVFQVEVTIPNPLNRLKVGMIASIRTGGDDTMVTAVPLSAIVRSNNGSDSYGVFVLEDQAGKPIARLRNVQLGQTYGNTVAITGGVKIGEQVITTGSSLVADGDPVQVVQ